MADRVSVLDHGYLEAVESWGSDERIIESARMSTGKGFLGWGPRCRNCQDAVTDEDRTCPNPSPGKPLIDCGRGGHMFDAPGDEKLLRYLYENKHATPFEFGGLVIEVQAPIFVFREWHRHRTQCLAPDTLVHFDAPKSRDNRRFVYKMRIEDVWKKWQPTQRRDRPERQVNPFFPRSRIQGMQLRMLDEETKEIVYTRIVAVIRGEPKPMVRVTTTSGRSIVATREHRFATNLGWKTLGEATSESLQLVLEGTTRAKAERWDRPAINESSERWVYVPGAEKYFVSTEGRVKRSDCATTKLTVGANGYDVVSLKLAGNWTQRTVHSLVLESFVGPRPSGQEARHLNGNRADNRLENLSWGTAQANANDRVCLDRQQRLVPVLEEIVSVEDAGTIPTYDLTVEGPFHNFVADGFVVHNSYNEMSARYTPLPDVNYRPTEERCIVVPGSNKQARGTGERVPTHEEVIDWLESYLDPAYVAAQRAYARGLEIGIPKEVARLPVPVARYSRMRASANLRNWLAFLTLRMAPNAQYEIRQYANAVGDIIAEKFPRTWELFAERKGQAA